MLEGRGGGVRQTGRWEGDKEGEVVVGGGGRARGIVLGEGQ